MKSTSLLIAVFFIATLFAADSLCQTLSGGISKGTVARGGTARAYVVLSIPEGLHVNSYKPDNKYAIPTRMSVSGSGVNAYGITYPPGKKRTFSFSETPISVYEGRAYMGFTIAVPRNYRGKTIRVKAAVRYQACTDEVCYAPKTKTIWLSARVTNSS